MTLRVYVARWLLPISAPPVDHGAVAVADGRIVYVGPAASAPLGLRVDLGRAVLLPGLVNAHCHLELTAMRGLLEELPFRRWILRLTRTRQAVMTPERKLASARVGLAEGLGAGITTYGDVTDEGTSLEAMRELGVRGIVFQEVFGPDPATCEEAIAGLRARVSALQARETVLVRVGVSPHAPYSVSDPLFTATASFARAAALPLTVHIAESAAEFDLVTRATGDFADALRGRNIAVAPRATSPIELLRRTGVLDAKPLLIHAVRISAADLDAIAGSGSRVAHCPASNAKLGHGIAPLVELREAGVPVGFGSDSVASSNRMDLLDEGRLAALQQRARLGQPAAITAREVLELATLGGARALGLDGEIGSLERGKAADLVAFPLDGERDEPVQAPEDALVFGAAGRRPRLVTVAGRELLRDAALAHDLRDDLAVVRETAAALSDHAES